MSAQGKLILLKDERRQATSQREEIIRRKLWGNTHFEASLPQKTVYSAEVIYLNMLFLNVHIIKHILVH